MTNFKTLIENILNENYVNRSQGVAYKDYKTKNYETGNESFHATSGPIYHGLGKVHGKAYAKTLAEDHNLKAQNIDDHTFELEGNNNNIKRALQDHITRHYNHLN